jgi:hypothetical protein
VRRLTPPLALRTGSQRHHQARYQWTVEQPA